MISSEKSYLESLNKLESLTLIVTNTDIQELFFKYIKEGKHDLLFIQTIIYQFQRSSNLSLLHQFLTNTRPSNFFEIGTEVKVLYDDLYTWHFNKNLSIAEGYLFLENNELFCKGVITDLNVFEHRCYTIAATVKDDSNKNISTNANVNRVFPLRDAFL